MLGFYSLALKPKGYLTVTYTGPGSVAIGSALSDADLLRKLGEDAGFSAITD